VPELAPLVSVDVEPVPVEDDELGLAPEFIEEDDPVPVEPVFELEPVDEPLGLVEPLVPGLVDRPEPMSLVAVLFVLEPEAPPGLPVLPAEVPVEPAVPPVPCATTIPVPRANATAAAIVNMRGCLLMIVCPVASSWE
jgi:hypothetical protein